MDVSQCVAFCNGFGFLIHGEYVPVMSFSEVTGFILYLETNERFEFAGLSNGDECFCGNDFSQTIADDDDCDIPCPGFPGQICGGLNRLRLI